MRTATWITGFWACLFIGFACNEVCSAPIDVVAAKTFPNAQQPQVAVSPSGQVHLVFGTGNSIYSVASSDGAKTFNEPVKVGTLGALALGMRRGPRIVATEKTIVITAIGGKVGKGRDEDLLTWRSADNGKTWDGPTRVNSIPASAREGLHHTTAAPDGTITCVWLDLRSDQMQVYGANSADGGTNWTGEKLIYASPDGSVCECCQPQASYDADGTLHVMWRNQIGGKRDMYAASSKDHGKSLTPAAKLGKGSWLLQACPMDGGGLAADAKGRLTTVWMRKKELFRCEPGQPEISLGKGEQAWAAAGADGVHLVWIAGRPGHVLALAPGASQPVQLAERGFDPVVAGAVAGKGPTVAAWEEGAAGAKRIRAMILPANR